jgi:hypothetical protein
VRLLLIVALALVAVSGGAALAQPFPTITDGGVTNQFPEGMVFSVAARSDSPIQKLRLRYTILPDGTAARGEANFEPALSVSSTFELAGNDPPRIYLAPGTTIEYYWEVTDADGDVATSEPTAFFYEDIRFDWAKLEADGVGVYYYSGSDDDAASMLDVAAETLEAMTELLGADIDFPIKVWIYDSVSDMRPALSRRSETYEQSVITAGVRVASDTVLVLGNVSFDTLRHELTHIVTALAGEGPFGTLPAWLDEGTAVFGQHDQGGFGAALERAVDRGNVLSVRSITSYPGDPETVNLFYGQSWSLVSYLVDTYGGERFAQLFAEFQAGSRADDALNTVYGFDQGGLEDEWRVSEGLPLRSSSGEPPLPDPSEPGAGSDQPQQANDGGASTGVVVGLMVGTLALAATIGLAGWALARRFR